MQETFLKIQRSIAGFRGQSSFVTWTFRILVNTCHDARRKRTRKKEVAHEDLRQATRRRSSRAPRRRIRRLKLALERALAELTQHQRDVFLLYEVEGFKHSQICGDVGDHRSRVEEHAVSGEEKFASDARAAAQQ